MRVFVTGGPGFSDTKFVRGVLDNLHARHHIDSIIIGGVQGADSLAEYWANLNAVPVEVFIPDWQKHGRAAEAVRNTQVIETKPDLAVIFPGDEGTRICRAQVNAAGIKVYQPAYFGGHAPPAPARTTPSLGNGKDSVFSPISWTVSK